MVCLVFGFFYVVVFLLGDYNSGVTFWFRREKMSEQTLEEKVNS